MERQKFISTSDYKGYDFYPIKELINLKFNDFILNQSNWKSIESNLNNHKFIINPHSKLKQFITFMSSAPWFSGNELVDLTIHLNSKSKNIELKIISEDSKNSFDKLIGFNYRQLNILSLFVKRKTYANNIEYVFMILFKIAEEAINFYEVKRQNENLELINKFIKDTPALIPNKSLDELLNKVDGNIESKIISQMLILINNYDDCVSKYHNITLKLGSSNFHKEEQLEIDHIIKVIPIYYNYIQFLEFSIKTMISYLIDKNLVSFYKIYNEYEKLGFFIGAGEKVIINTLQETNALISKEINLSAKLIQKLSSIESKIDYSNFLSTINTIKYFTRE